MIEKKVGPRLLTPIEHEIVEIQSQKNQIAAKYSALLTESMTTCVSINIMMYLLTEALNPEFAETWKEFSTDRKETFRSQLKEMIAAALKGFNEGKA